MWIAGRLVWRTGRRVSDPRPSPLPGADRRAVVRCRVRRREEGGSRRQCGPSGASSSLGRESFSQGAWGKGSRGRGAATVAGLAVGHRVVRLRMRGERRPDGVCKVLKRHARRPGNGRLVLSNQGEKARADTPERLRRRLVAACEVRSGGGRPSPPAGKCARGRRLGQRMGIRRKAVAG